MESGADVVAAQDEAVGESGDGSTGRVGAVSEGHGGGEGVGVESGGYG